MAYNFFEDIKADLIKGENFENDAADWFTINRHKKTGGELIICFRGDVRWYKNIRSYARRVAQLIKRGY